jgi:pimeloyl-ACP methyl ester carboxylesterase
MGFSQHTHSINPTLIADAKVSNNQNDMKIVCMYYQSHDWVCGEDITTKLRDHFPPPLILHGLDDHIVPVECGQELSNAWGVELITIPNASHMVLMEQTQVMAQHIAQYLVRS